MYPWAQVDPDRNLMMQASDDQSEAPVDSGNVAEGDDQCEEPGDSGNVEESEPGLEKEFSFGHSLPEPVVELGLAFLAKLQNKGVPVRRLEFYIFLSAVFTFVDVRVCFVSSVGSCLTPSICGNSCLH